LENLPEVGVSVYFVNKFGYIKSPGDPNGLHILLLVTCVMCFLKALFDTVGFKAPIKVRTTCCVVSLLS